MNDRFFQDLPTSEQYARELNRIRDRKKTVQTTRSLISGLLVVAAMVIMFSTLCMPVLRVTGAGMMPTLRHSEIVLCNRWSDYTHGDIIALQYNNKILLKRVIGLPGDLIEIDAQGNVSVNGQPLNEPYVETLSLGQCDVSFPLEVPENRVFVLGDDRENSIDSRISAVGCIADEYIIGKVVFRVLPAERMTLL